MNWILLCIVVAFLYSIVAFFDNYITDVIFRGDRPQAIKVFNGAFYSSVAIFIALVFGIESLPVKIAILAMVSGAIHSIASIPYYLALRNEESTTAAIYFQLAPILCFFADIFILGRTITTQQIIAFVVILLAPIVILFAQKTRSKKANKKKLQSDLLLIAYVVIASASTILFSHISDNHYDSWSLFFWYLLGRFTFDTCATIFMPSWRKYVKRILKRKPLKTIAIIYGSGIIYIIGDFIFRYALSLTNSSFVSVVTNASELILTFILGIILTLIWPKFGREKLDKRNIGAHFVAIVFVIISIILIQ